jgi:hypothetical protein
MGRDFKVGPTGNEAAPEEGYGMDGGWWNGVVVLVDGETMGGRGGWRESRNILLGGQNDKKKQTSKHEGWMARI